ncbi:hypothetical protein FISHEDRAFT_9433, partial [Fistulina hepatica ATCC 64428]
SDMKKRTKTQRACDSCRTRKIRCDVVVDSDPPLCQHCKQYGFECTFFLPITETRFKKKKATEDKAKSPLYPVAPQPPPASQAAPHQPVQSAYDTLDARTFAVSKSGDGAIQIQSPPVLPPHVMPHTDFRIEPDVIQTLLNAFFVEVAPILPVVTLSEFLAMKEPKPILLYSMCLVAAARRDVPQNVFDAIRYTVNQILKAEDVLSTPSMVNVQSLLILCMLADCHSPFVPAALSALWVRLGSAVRMAQDLGLHRAESARQNDIELRRRVWGACVICDRWTSLTYGHPCMIDVQDCDARLPSSGDPHDLYMDELVRLSVILGRVLKTIYSPTGLALITDDMLYGLLADIDAWETHLPDRLRFHGPSTSTHAGLLHLLYTCVCMTFWRVFMRISYSCPAHLKFGLTSEQWMKLVNLTGEAIDWLDANEKLYDVWLLIAYAATSCALYHTWARRKDTDAVAKLLKLRDCIKRWDSSLSPDHMSARRKTAEIIALLYEATQSPNVPVHPNALKPAKPTSSGEGLDFQKDPTRPGGAVFIAHSKPTQDNAVAAPAAIAEAAGSRNTGAAGTSSKMDTTFLLDSSSFAPPLPGTTSVASPALDFAAGMATNPGMGLANVNPGLNVAPAAGGNVQILNMLDVTQPPSPDALAEFALADGFLEGLPGGMFDWGQWETFFARI